MSPNLLWYAIRTKPRQEDRAVENLRYWGIETLAAQLEERSGRRGSPLFPGYIFARFESPTMLQKIRFTRGVAYVVGFGGVPTSIGDEFIEEIRARMDENGIILKTMPLNPGDEVVIQSGFMRDFVGIFERALPGTERVQVLLRTVAYSAHVELPRFDIRRIAG
jgi:transcriptional antiterminator RfaH